MSADLSSPPLTPTTPPPSPVAAEALGWSAARDWLLRRRRTRALGSDDRAGRRVRAQARAAWWDFVRGQWRVLAVMAATAATVITTLAWVMPAGFARGVVVGVGVTMAVGALAVLTVQVTGTAQLTSGASAEQRTSSELRKLRAHGWRVINHLAFEHHDIDHVLIGPGGVIAVETKWSSHDWQRRQSRPWRDAAVEQAQGNARTLGLWLKKFSAGDVASVVFCWGAQRPDRSEQPAQPERHGSSQVIFGSRAAQAWRDQLTSTGPSGALSDDQIERIWDHLDQFVEKRDRDAAARNPELPTLSRLYWTAASLVAAFTAGLVGNLTALTATRSWTIWTLVTIAEAAIGLGGLRLPWSRRAAVSWLAAVITGVTITAISVIISAT